MQAGASLKQTVTHLFDAVRFADHARELEESARNVEGELEAALAKLETHAEGIFNLLAAIRADQDPALRELSQQIQGFVTTAKEQAKTKLQKRARERLEDYQGSASTERDKALKSLEAFFASDPVPVIESVVQVRLLEGVYEAKSRHECEGGLKYDFRLAAQNSRIFHEPFMLSQLGYEVRVPVRFSRAILSKSRVPGFERLDQYTLAEAETSGEKLRANFEKQGNGGKVKVVTSGEQADGFVGIEYSDQVHAVSVMNDPSLVAFVELGTIRKAAGELVTELGDLAKKKVALIRLAVNGDDSVDPLKSRQILERVLEVMGSPYRGVMKRLADGLPAEEGGEELSLDFVKARLKVLGDELSGTVSRALGLT